MSVFDLRHDDAPCYACLFPEGRVAARCVAPGFGVFAPLVGVVGSIQAAEALKLLMGIGQSLNGRLLLHNALDGDWRAIRLKKDPACPVCAARGHLTLGRRRLGGGESELAVGFREVADQGARIGRFFLETLCLAVLRAERIEITLDIEDVDRLGKSSGAQYSANSALRGTSFTSIDSWQSGRRVGEILILAVSFQNQS